MKACFRAQQKKSYHMGIRGNGSRNTLPNANKIRGWRIYADFVQVLIEIARRLYVGDELDVKLENTIYALDSSTIDLCLSVFPGPTFVRAKPPSSATRSWIFAAISRPLFKLGSEKVNNMYFIEKVIKISVFRA